MKMIKFENVSFGYSEEDVLKNISIEIPKGKYTCILGHNGSGKSTIAKLILGLEIQKHGKIFVDELEVNEQNLDEIRNKVGIVFQNPDNQFIAQTVEDDIAFTLENACVPSEKMQPLIEKYANHVGMLKYLKHEPEKLSGGQKQRVALASVLVGKSEYVIFDEATSMLDPIGKKEILSLIQEVHKNQNLTIISITHDMEEVINADHVIVLEKGKVALSGTFQEVFKNKRILESLKLKNPFVLEVKDIATALGFSVSSTLSLEKVVEEICQSK